MVMGVQELWKIVEIIARIMAVQVLGIVGLAVQVWRVVGMVLETLVE